MLISPLPALVQINQGISLVYHPSENEYISLSGEYIISPQGWISSMRGIVYHHYGVLIHAKSVMICKKRAIFSLFFDDIHDYVVMICHYSVMDKKSRIKMIRLFWCGRRDLNPYVGNTRPSNVRVCRFRHSREHHILYTTIIRLSSLFLKFF